MDQLLLQAMLIGASFLTLFYVVSKVKKAKMQIEDTIFWILFAFVILIASIFPSLIFYIARLLKIESPANLTYLMVIFILIVNQFRMQRKLSEVKNQVKTIIQNRAIDNNEKSKHS